ncbi:MAG: class I SAM-dependent methyltransferase [Anaerolineae bacterium]|nr:class I SAM-dependent methyltransferase [Anaerolineae bacterium]
MRYQRWVATGISEDDRILDLGCGRGGIVERLGSVGSWTGTDPDLDSLKEHRRPSLSRCCTKSERLPFTAAAFDTVVASWVLEHMPNPEQTFREIARLLRPAGSFFFLTPNRSHPLPRLSRTISGLHPLQQRIVTLFYGRQPADTYPVAYRANTATEIGRLGAQANLRLVRIEWIEDPSYLAWGPLSFLAALGLDLVLPGTWRVHLVGELTKA